MRISPLRTPLAVLRKFTGLTLPDFASQVGIDVGYLQNIELARRALRPAPALKISRATGISADWLMAGDPKARMIDREGKAYTSERWALAKKTRRWKPTTAQAIKQNDAANRMSRRIQSILSAATETDRLELAEKLITDALLSIGKKFGLKLRTFAEDAGERERAVGR